MASEQTAEQLGFWESRADKLMATSKALPDYFPEDGEFKEQYPRLTAVINVLEGEYAKLLTAGDTPLTSFGDGIVTGLVLAGLVKVEAVPLTDEVWGEIADEIERITEEEGRTLHASWGPESPRDGIDRFWETVKHNAVSGLDEYPHLVPARAGFTAARAVVASWRVIEARSTPMTPEPAEEPADLPAL